ncbi:MAG: DUF3857 domain-containing protein [Sphingobacteriales bacterium]|nr:MAG: DUF3857 domain-containing protein [Sphingobacteriales bacterium]
MKVVLTLLFFFGLVFAKGKDAPELATALIPASLKQNAVAVIRNYDLDIRVHSQTDIVLKETRAISILSDKGAELAVIKEQYDKFRSIRELSAMLYDRDGKKVKQIKKSDFTDHNSYEYSFYGDDRVKEYSFNYSVYPYTIVLETERKLSSLFFLPDWDIQPARNIAVEKSSFRLEYPDELHINHRSFHLKEELLEERADGRTTLTGKAANITALAEDALVFAPGYHLSSVMFSPVDIVLDGHAAKFDSWKNFGYFYYELNKGRDVLPVHIKEAVRSMTDTCRTTRAKTDVLYKYLKNTTRYVSIQLGIGGWQTLPAGFVAEKGYGDCKALTNYMGAMLQAAGISAYPALVSAGSDYSVMQGDFVSNSFNHVILAVPDGKDTVWVECTAKDIPAGYLSAFTHDRNVLLITPEGGVVVHTPAYTHNDNKLVRKVSYMLDTSGQLDAQVTLHCAGSFFEADENLLRESVKGKVEKQLSNKLSLPNHTIVGYSFQAGNNGYIPVFNANIHIAGVPKTNKSGNRMFLAPFILSTDYVPFAGLPKDRSEPFFIGESFEVVDTVSVDIPAGYRVEYLPAAISVDHELGGYSCSYSVKDYQLIAVRSYRQVRGSYLAARYPAFVKLVKAAMGGGDSGKIALVKKQ